MARKDSAAGSTALITGASAGIGAELSRQFAAAGYDLVLVARSEDKLEMLADELHGENGVEVTVLPRDLLKRNAARALLHATEDLGLEIDVLVNNAGVVIHGDFKNQELTDIRQVMQLNNAVLVEMTHHFLPPMIERGRGRILNISSASAFQSMPTLAIYAASKSFVLSFSEALHEEVRQYGVTVTAQCPGFTRTDLLDESFVKLPGIAIGSAKDVAAEALRACEAGEAVNVPGLGYRLLTTAIQYSPRDLTRRTMGLISRNLMPDD